MVERASAWVARIRKSTWMLSRKLPKTFMAGCRVWLPANDPGRSVSKPVGSVICRMLETRGIGVPPEVPRRVGTRPT